MTQVAGQKKILVLGAHGQLGRAYLKLLKQEEPTAEIVGASHSDADLRRPENYLRYIEKIRPAVIFNAAAYTKVDLAESENELALEINAVAPGRIAEWCARQNVPFVHFSTDYVFPGSGEAPWLETDPVAPLNFYGRSKAEGEVRVTQARGHSLIFRTSWVYDSQGKNFLTTMLQLGKEREILRVVGDQIGAPTYAPDLALASYLALKKSLEMPNFSGGIFHLVNSGFTSWYEFAVEIFKAARTQGIPLKLSEVIPILSSEYPTLAERPKNSRLSTSRVFDTFGIRMPQWQVGLAACMKEIP